MNTVFFYSHGILIRHHRMYSLTGQMFSRKKMVRDNINYISIFVIEILIK